MRESVHLCFVQLGGRAEAPISSLLADLHAIVVAAAAVAAAAANG